MAFVRVDLHQFAVDRFGCGNLLRYEHVRYSKAGEDYSMNSMNRSLRWLAIAVRLMLILVFVLSALGKLLDQSAAAVGLNRLLGLSYGTARVAVIALALAELLVALALLSKRFLRMLIILPVLFLIVVLYTNAAGVDCGCFGALPVLSQFSLAGHLLLLAGMALGIAFLIMYESWRARESGEALKSGLPSPRRLTVAGTASLVLILIAILTLPFARDHRPVEIPADFPTVDRLAVEANISSQQAILVDARSEFEYEIDHIEGAINIPFDFDKLDSLVNRFELRGNAIIVYCSGVDCPAAETLAGRLREHGCSKVSIYPGGWEDWVEYY